MKIAKHCASVAFLTFLSLTAQAHPHSFISLHSQWVVENGMLTAIQMRWTMDELTSADLLYDAGEAKSGDNVWKRLATEVMTNVQEQHFFSELWQGATKVQLDNQPKTYSLERDGLQAVLTFTLPLITPQPLAGHAYRLTTFDPSYFVDMHYDQDSDVVPPPVMPSSCAVTIDTPKPDEKLMTYALSLDTEDAPPEDMALGQQFAQQVMLVCR